ncbi:cytochrome P450 [Streptomyces sp. SDr-06]|uniref:cytochrome P450 n=1 Tax=Streptomyces sp. SDr-06 TaxID=2267702 RepID=UPI000DEBF4A0|nr:cytochrome P450 [Streptomyces sp. SDr-06]RCH67727.1 cytochrome P450 [Streptomyces sp. SDr-06]
MTLAVSLLDASPADVERDIGEAYALVRAFDSDGAWSKDADPHAEFAALRRRRPVHGSTWERVLTGADLTDTASTPVWHVVSFAAAERVLRDEDTFSSSAYDDSMGRVVGRSFLQMDHEEHRSWRNVLHAGMNRQTVLAHRAQIRSSLAARLADTLARPGGDLVADVAFPVALTTIARLIGLPPGTRIGTLYAWAVGLTEDPGHRMADAMGELLAMPSAWPPGSLVDLLSRADSPAIGSGPQLLPAVRLLLSTGTEPPFRSLATLMYAVLSDRTVLESLRADPSIAPAVFHECWRWECPLTWALRRCTTDTEVAGQSMGRGDLVCVNLASANRDEARWSHADRFDARREYLPSLALGTGPHLCLGRHLAAVEAHELLSELASLAPFRWTLDTDGPVGRGFRSARRLRVSSRPGQGL